LASPKCQRDLLVKTAGYCLAYISLGLVLSSLGPTLLGLAENTRSQVREISYLFLGRIFGHLLGSLLGGRLYDRLPGHMVMAAALFILVVTMMLVPLIPRLLALIAVLFILGIAGGVIDVGVNTLLVWLHRANVGPFMNALHFTFGVGAFIGPLIIGQVLSRSGEMTWAYWTLALLIVPSTIWLLSLPSPPIQTGAEEGPAGRINYWLVFLITFFFFLYGGAEIGFGNWVFSYAVALNLTAEANAAYLTSGFYGALTAGRLLVIPIAARLRPRTILFGDLAGCLLSLAILSIWPASLLAVWVGTISLGLSMASVFPVTLSFAGRRIRTTGKVTSFFLAGASLGGMTMPWLTGQLFETIGPRVAIWVTSANLAAAVAVLMVLIIYSGRIIAREE
jgi:MFS transporter, FHS family, Na+ dependent glucose transporter 1